MRISKGFSNIALGLGILIVTFLNLTDCDIVTDVPKTKDVYIYQRDSPKDIPEPELLPVLHGNDTRCRISEYLCSNKKCIPINRFCDGSNDCGDSSDEPRHCTRCNKTYYGDIGRTYELELHRPREDLVPYVCLLTITAAGGIHGDLVQTPLYWCASNQKGKKNADLRRKFSTKPLLSRWHFGIRQGHDLDDPLSSHDWQFIRTGRTSNKWGAKNLLVKPLRPIWDTDAEGGCDVGPQIIYSKAGIPIGFTDISQTSNLETKDQYPTIGKNPTKQCKHKTRRRHGIPNQYYNECLEEESVEKILTDEYEDLLRILRKAIMRSRIQL